MAECSMGGLSYTNILEVNLFAFADRLFQEDFTPVDGANETVCRHCRRIQNIPVEVRSIEAS